MAHIKVYITFREKKRRAGERYRQQMAPATLLFSLFLSFASLYLLFGAARTITPFGILFSPLLLFFCFARDIYNEGVQCAFYASYLTLHYFPSRSRRTLLLIFLSIFYYLMWIYIVCQSVTHHTHKK